jgi:26S proteasome regulatory subunit N11
VPRTLSQARHNAAHTCGRRLACTTTSAHDRTQPQVGKLDPKRHLEKDIDLVMSANIIQTLGTMLDTVVF